MIAAADCFRAGPLKALGDKRLCKGPDSAVSRRGTWMAQDWCCSCTAFGVHVDRTSRARVAFGETRRACCCDKVPRR